MLEAVQAPSSSRAGPTPALAAARTRLGLVTLLFALAALGWWWLDRQMAGMDEGSWTALGTFGWFLGVWIVMMAAMMLPSISPTAAPPSEPIPPMMTILNAATEAVRPPDGENGRIRWRTVSSASGTDTRVFSEKATRKS